jgi:hypothetical protein
MGKPEEILERNRQRSAQRAQQGAKPENATDILMRITEGGIFLAGWGAALILAVILFAVSSLIGAAMFGSWINGVILGVVVTFGAGYVLYKLGRHF